MLILNQDCIEAMRSMPEASVDAIVTDPPYGLEFMGKEWDRCDGGDVRQPFRGEIQTPDNPFGRTPVRYGYGGDAYAIHYRQQEWHRRWAREAFRVLKPGGHLLAFGGTRTYHRLACAVEDAGFEIRDSLHWLYGCLSEDSEILTADGWRRGVDVAEGDLVAAWDAVTGRILLQPVERKTLAPWSGPLVRFVNDDTDQLLTPNHRVYHLPRQRRMEGGVRRQWYGEQYEVAEAADINRWNGIKLPLAGVHDGPGIGGVDYAALLGWVWTEGGFDRAPSRGVRIYQSSSANPAKVAEIDGLLGRLVPTCRRYERERVYQHGGAAPRAYTEVCWFFAGEVAERVRADLPGKHPTWALLWRMTEAEKRAFWDAAMKGDGSGDDFYQKDAADLAWAQALVATIGMRGKIVMRKAPRDGGSVCVTPRATTELQARHLQYASEGYEGNVWCVKVQTGAFVARRKGKVFITGNSGFPKSLNVSKAIDATTLTGKSSYEAMADVEDSKGAPLGQADDSFIAYGTEGSRQGKLRHGARRTATAPATPEAAAWDGWGTALKPAHEPIVLARKPLDGNVAANVLAHGTGGINVDGCRIATGDDLNGGTYSGGKRNPMPGDTRTATAAGRCGEDGRLSPDDFKQPAGRWPPNVLLTHSEACVCVGTRKVVRSLREAPGTTANDGMSETTESIPAYECAPGCPVAELDRQSEEAGMHSAGHACDGTRNYGRAYDATSYEIRGRSARIGDTGGASRFMPQFTFDPQIDIPFQYVAKPARGERDAGLHDLQAATGGEATNREDGSDGLKSPRAGAGRNGGSRNIHPTVKPVALMEWLVRLVTPRGGVVLDPFLGSGSTGCAAVRLGFEFIGIEREKEYVEIARRRIMLAKNAPRTKGLGELERAAPADPRQRSLFG